MADRELPLIPTSKLMYSLPRVFQHYLNLERKLRTVKPRIDNTTPRMPSVSPGRATKVRLERKREIDVENYRVAMRMVEIANVGGM